jgi:hypothetical protein
MNVGQRYRGIKGKYWALFSLYIRRRDFERFGTCISCGKTVSHYTEFDAGHFISAGNGGFLFFLMSEMSTASAGTITRSMAIIFYFIDGLDTRYGAGTADALEQRYRDVHFKGKTTKEWNKKQYEAEIEILKEKLANLNTHSLKFPL